MNGDSPDLRRADPWTSKSGFWVGLAHAGYSTYLLSVGLIGGVLFGVGLVVVAAVFALRAYMRPSVSAESVCEIQRQHAERLRHLERVMEKRNQ